MAIASYPFDHSPVEPLGQGARQEGMLALQALFRTIVTIGCPRETEYLGQANGGNRMTVNRETSTESTKDEPRQVEAARAERRYEPAVLDNVTDLDALLEILGPARGQGQISRNGFGP